ncbi:MAG: N-acetyltransferase [Bacteroidales bacterium]|nr:N-acetyltransferase [Bacteroidales bacterium]
MITVRPVAPTKTELKKYVKFGIDLYEGNKYFVPPLIFDEVNTLMPKKNPAFDFCEAQSFMAYRDDEPVGRITAIINRNVNDKNGEKNMRFGFVDLIDDAAVVDALFDAARQWGRERGMERIVGPMGFSDLDHEGMLVEGFDEMGTMATIYNYPYYPKHMERLGFRKEVDYIEFRITVPEKVPDKYMRIASIVERRYNLHVKTYTSRKQLKADYGKAVFQLFNEAYDKLYGYSTLTAKQIDYYIEMYLGILRLDNLCVIVDEDDKLVGVGISMPSLSHALRKSGGKLFPMGWWYLLEGLRGNTDTVDLMMVAIKPEYQGKGVNALLFSNLLPTYIKMGYKWAESNIELEGNESVQKQWDYFERRQHRRRRIYAREI